MFGMGIESCTIVVEEGRFAKLDKICMVLVLILSVQFVLMTVHVVDAHNGDQPHLTRSYDGRHCDNGIEWDNHPRWSANYSVMPESLSKREPKLSTASPVPWDQNYMNLYTPVPNDGLAISDDGMDASLKITGTNQSCKCELSISRLTCRIKTYL